MGCMQGERVLRHYAAILFDMDGTLLTSIPAVERVWNRWADRVGIPAAGVLAHLHGRRAVDTLRHFAPPHVDLDTEAAWLEAAEIADADGVEAIRGAAELLARLPARRWAVVTSACRALALRRIEAAGLPPPGVLIAAEDVRRGKPDPQGYLLGAEALGVDIRDCLVFEDTEAGLQAGRAAGADVIRILGPQGEGEGTPGIGGYDELSIRPGPEGIAVTLPPAGTRAGEGA